MNPRFKNTMNDLLEWDIEDILLELIAQRGLIETVQAFGTALSEAEEAIIMPLDPDDQEY